MKLTPSPACARVDFQGLFSMSHMSYTGTVEVERDEPSLGEMTLAAIEVLRKNKNGYVLFVEGGRIDHAHHQNLVSAVYSACLHA